MLRDHNRSLNVKMCVVVIARKFITSFLDNEPTRDVNNKFWPLHYDKASVPDIFYIQIQPYILSFIGKVTVLPSKINCANGKAPSSARLA